MTDLENTILELRGYSINCPFMLWNLIPTVISETRTGHYDDVRYSHLPKPFPDFQYLSYHVIVNHFVVDSKQRIIVGIENHQTSEKILKVFDMNGTFLEDINYE